MRQVRKVLRLQFEARLPTPAPTHKSLLIQPKLLRGCVDAISLLLVLRKYLEASRKCLPCEFGFAEHHARSDKLDPSISVAW